MCTVYVLILEYAILAAWEGDEYPWAGDLILELQFAPLYVMVPNPFLQAEFNRFGPYFIGRGRKFLYSIC